MEASHRRPAQRVLGKYTLIAQLAQGGMGEICLARLRGMAGFEKIVVLKRVLPHLAEDRKYIDMLLDEGRIAARLAHQNICQVLELGEVDGQYYIAMEYLEGVSLADLLRRMVKLGATLDARLAAAIVHQACEGLHCAHELADSGGAPTNLVHRDISPSNLLVTSAGLVKVLDFGIAKTPDKRSQTRTGTIKGKWAYMSPEQVRRQPLDRRSDIFSLGVVLFEALTSRRLFRRPSEYETCEAIINGDVPSARQLRPELPEELEQVVAKALARDRDQRFATAREMGKALIAALRPQGGMASFSELSELVDLHFADSLDERRAFIEHIPQGEAATAVDELPRAPVTVPRVSDDSGDSSSFAGSSSGSAGLPTQDTRSIADAGQLGELLGLPARPAPGATPSASPALALSTPASVTDDRSESAVGMTGIRPARRSRLPWAIPVVAVVLLGSGVLAYVLTKTSRDEQPMQPFHIVNYGGVIEFEHTGERVAAEAGAERASGEGGSGDGSGRIRPGADSDTSTESGPGADHRARDTSAAAHAQDAAAGKASARGSRASADRTSNERGAQVNKGGRRYERALERRLSGLRACFDEHADDPALATSAASVLFDLRIDRDGRVVSARLEPAQIHDSLVGACLRTVVGAIDFGAHDEPVRVSIPVGVQGR